MGWGLLLGLAWLMGSAWMISSFGKRDETRHADAAVVLGAAAWHQKPSPVLEARLEHAVELYRKGIVKNLILTGGFGEKAPMAESEVARDFVIARGVPASSVLIETASHSTHENLVEASRLMREKHLKTCLLVSDPLHMRRAVRMMRDLSVPAFSSPTNRSAYVSWGVKAGFLAREVFFFTGYLLAGR